MDATDFIKGGIPQDLRARFAKIQEVLRDGRKEGNGKTGEGRGRPDADGTRDEPQGRPLSDEGT
jgi:hypothetical protein